MALFYRSIWNTISSRIPLGKNILNYDWDVCIVLDSCRYDSLSELAGEYDFIDKVRPAISVGSMSPEWILKTFTEPYRNVINKTGLVMGHGWYYYLLHLRLHEYNSVSSARKNIKSDHLKIKDTYKFLYQGFPQWNLVEMDEFAIVDHVWKLKQNAKSNYYHTPEIVTDRAVDTARNYQLQRLIVHYMPPHTPFEGLARQESRPMHEWERRPGEAFESGEKSMADFYEAHKHNLRLVLNEVQILVDNVEAEKILITADHGDALGEYNKFGHPWGHIHPKVKIVPWVTTSGQDTGEYKSHYSHTSTSEVAYDEVISNLQNLGYV